MLNYFKLDKWQYNAARKTKLEPGESCSWSDLNTSNESEGDYFTPLERPDRHVFQKPQYQ